MARDSSATPQPTSISQLAAAQLKIRLKLVRTQLKSTASHWKKDARHLHELRISLRRALACLQLFRPCCRPEKQYRWLKRRLRAVLKSTSPARDLDVLLARPLAKSGKAGQTLRKSWISKRQKAQKPLQRHHSRLIQEGKLRKHSRALLKATAGMNCPEVLPSEPYRWALLQLQQQLVTLLRAIPADPDIKALHKFRIAAKQLRYTAEIVAEITADSCVTDVLNQLTAVQKQLGRLQDESVAAKSLAQAERKSSKRPSGASKLRQQADSCNETGVRLSHELSAWLKQDVQPVLRRLAGLLVPPEAVSLTPAASAARKPSRRRRS